MKNEARRQAKVREGGSSPWALGLGLIMVLSPLGGKAGEDPKPLWEVDKVADVSSSLDGSKILLLFRTGDVTLPPPGSEGGPIVVGQYRREVRDATGKVLKRSEGPYAKLSGDGQRLFSTKGIEGTWRAASWLHSRAVPGSTSPTTSYTPLWAPASSTSTAASTAAPGSLSMTGVPGRSSGTSTRPASSRLPSSTRTSW